MKMKRERNKLLERHLAIKKSEAKEKEVANLIFLLIQLSHAL